MHDQTPIVVGQCPAVHELTFGAYIQEPVRLGERVTAIPCVPVGFSSEAAYAAQYVVVIGGAVDQPAFDSLRKQGENAFPVIALIAKPSLLSLSTEQAEADVRDMLDRARLVLAWATGESPSPFALVTVLPESRSFRLLPPISRHRIRLGFGNTRADFAKSVEAPDVKILIMAENI